MSELEIKMEKMKTLTINDETFDIIDDGAVRFDKLQSLTDAQKAQARKNIGAVTVEDVVAALPNAEEGEY